MTLQTPFSPVSFDKSFMKIRSAVIENGCLVFCGGRKKRGKNTKKTSEFNYSIQLQQAVSSRQGTRQKNSAPARSLLFFVVEKHSYRAGLSALLSFLFASLDVSAVQCAAL